LETQVDRIRIPLAMALIVGVFVFPAATAADEPADFAARADQARYACVPSLIWRHPELCPSYGPGNATYRLASIEAPDPPPPLPILEMPEPEDDIVPYTFAHVTVLPLDIYRHPVDEETGIPPVRTLLSGDWWLSLDEKVEYNGREWYQINEDEYIPADAVWLAQPSRFQGVYLADQPQQAFAWMNRAARPSVVPQGELNQNVPLLQRYQLVTILAEHQIDRQLWYLVGDDQWIEQTNVSRVDVDPVPEGVEPGAKWIEVDLFEQTIAAYQGARMVYATLISSGREHTATPPGLYQIKVKIRAAKMSMPFAKDGDPLYYYLEDVPWTMYFHEAYSIHAAYWHDAFGFRRSHGCVNLSPRDALWFFEWADPPIDDDTDYLYAGSGPRTWVWVHYSPLF
jgi:lipoprotein-anchoring transpeptidase ErfK/SrfK